MRLGKAKALPKTNKQKKPTKAAVRKQKKLIEIPLQNGAAGEDDDLLSAVDTDAAAFLSNLDAKAIAKSRKAVKEEWKHLKKQHNQEKPRPVARLSPALSDDPADDEEMEEDPQKNRQSKGKAKRNKKNEGQLIAEMEEDDLAFGSGDSDDSLSVMSEFLNGKQDGGDMSDFSSDFSSDLGSEDEDVLESIEGSEDLETESDTSSHARSRQKRKVRDQQDVEELYASKKRRRDAISPKPEHPYLPVILPDGSIQQSLEEQAQASKPRKILRNEGENEDENSENSETEEPSSSDESPEQQPEIRTNPLGPRFGRPGIRNILEIQNANERLIAARNELAVLSGDIMADPENSLNLLKRLLSFCQPNFSNGKFDSMPSLPIDQPIRALALLSMLAVLIDIVPQYRIRDVTDKEQDTKVSQVVARQREWENGLVSSYRRYLEVCEREVKGATPLQSIAIKCLCDLLEEKSQFNFAVNIMDVLAHRIGRLEWDDTSNMCIRCISKVFEQDTTGADSLHLVRLLSKAIKTASYRVNPAVFDVFLHLQLNNESGIRASGDHATRDDAHTQRTKQKWVKKGNRQPVHISKKSRKALKARKEVEKEYAEAEMVVSSEEKQRERTETLKILFALYFRILKLDQNTPLLAPTLEGLAKFAHLINVDFFRDILAVLRSHINSSASLNADDTSRELDLRQRLLCIVTAFDVLSGQGEALNIDLSDFIQDLYSILLSLSLSTDFEESPRNQSESGSVSRRRQTQTHLFSESDLLFHVLNKVFVFSRTTHPPSRVAAFAKRLLLCSLSWPEKSTKRALEIVRHLLVKYPQLDSILTTEDLRQDGQYRADALDIATSNADMALSHELATLEAHHFSQAVRAAANQLSTYTRN